DRHMDAAGRVEQHGVVEADAASVRSNQPGDDMGERGLAGTRGAEQRSHAGRGLEAGGELEFTELLFHVERQHHPSPWKRVPARRASHSAATNAISEIAIATTTRCPAAASAPG